MMFFIDLLGNVVSASRKSNGNTVNPVFAKFQNP